MMKTSPHGGRGACSGGSGDPRQAFPAAPAGYSRLCLGEHIHLPSDWFVPTAKNVYQLAAFCTITIVRQRQLATNAAHANCMAPSVADWRLASKAPAGTQPSELRCVRSAPASSNRRHISSRPK